MSIQWSPSRQPPLGKRNYHHRGHRCPDPQAILQSLTVPTRGPCGNAQIPLPAPLPRSLDGKRPVCWDGGPDFLFCWWISSAKASPTTFLLHYDSHYKERRRMAPVFLPSRRRDHFSWIRDWVPTSLGGGKSSRSGKTPCSHPGWSETGSSACKTTTVSNSPGGLSGNPGLFRQTTQTQTSDEMPVTLEHPGTPHYHLWRSQGLMTTVWFRT